MKRPRRIQVDGDYQLTNQREAPLTLRVRKHACRRLSGYKSLANGHNICLFGVGSSQEAVQCPSQWAGGVGSFYPSR